MTDTIAVGEGTAVVDLVGSDQSSVEEVKIELVVVQDDVWVSVETETVDYVVVENESVATATNIDREVVVVGQPGPPGRDGQGGAVSQVFILDVVPTASGIVSGKSYKANTVPANVNLQSAQTDTLNVRVMIGANGGSNYSPTVAINGIPAILTESSTKRWFTGYADVTLTGDSVITVTTTEGGEDSVSITYTGAGPAVTAVSWGPYPGTQTEAKAGDTMVLHVTTDPNATNCTVVTGGAVDQSFTGVVTGGVATIPVTIGAGSGLQHVQVKAQNSFGTFGALFASPDITLDQTYPTIGAISAQYPTGQTALNAGESATVSSTITNADYVAYASSDMSVDFPMVYAASKTVTNTSTGYKNSGTNYTITATKASNGAVSTRSGLIAYATVAPAAGISIVGNPARLISAPAGVDYEIRITPDQVVSSAPSLTASKGTWQGSWVNAGAYWKRFLRITDAMAKGAGLFSSLSLTGPSGIAGSTISSGSNYTVGGFAARTVTFPAFSRVAPIGTQVATESKTSAQITGGSAMTRHSDNGVYLNGYYIADADGAYNPTGSYLGLSDSAFAGANTSGTLQADVQEVA